MVKTGVETNWGSQVRSYGNSIVAVNKLQELNISKTTFTAYKDMNKFITEYNNAISKMQAYTRIQAGKMGKAGHNKVILDQQGSTDFTKGASLFG